MSTKNENLTFVTETLYNFLDDNGESGHNLHIYAIKTSDEYWRLNALIEAGRREEICNELGFYSWYKPIESNPGKSVSDYYCYIIGYFLIIDENTYLDV